MKGDQTEPQLVPLFRDARLEEPEKLTHETSDGYVITLEAEYMPSVGEWRWDVIGPAYVNNRYPTFREKCSGRAKNKRRALRYAMAALKYMRANP